MKKAIISLILATVLVFNIIPVHAVSAQIVYPESKHNYSNNFCGRWTYTHPDDTDGLFVTFSQDTYFGPGGNGYYDKVILDYACDYLEICSESEFGYNYETFFADELAGETIFIPGCEFEVILVTDSSDGYYGFKIEDISTQGTQTDYISVTYEINDDNTNKQYVKLDDAGALPVSTNWKNYIVYDKAIIGWKDGNGHEYRYKNKRILDYPNADYYYDDNIEYTNAFPLKPGDEITLTPIYTPVSITTDETFYFYNDGYTFENGYKMTNAHAKQLRKSYISSTWFNPFGILGIPLGLLLPGIYQKVPWQGSCCGFPIAILMQHYGMIDLCGEQNVSCVRDIEPTESITSALNFYNAVTPAAIACSNKAPVPGTEEYKTQIKKLYDTVSSGKPAVCFINCGYIDGVSYKNVFTIIKGILSKGIKYLATSFARTHCILLTGAYTDGDGNHIFIGYDENDASYCYGRPQTYRVIGDFRNIVGADSCWGSLDSVAWIDDVGCLESFKADGKTNASAWYTYYCSEKDTL